MHATAYMKHAAVICEVLDVSKIEQMVDALIEVRKQNGRMFILGVGGSAGNASHAVNDFRKLCGIETYSPMDNVSEISARTNDEGWETIFEGWLKTSNLSSEDILMVFSVGGGSIENNVSVNIIKAIQLAKEVGAKTLGIVGKAEGYTASEGDVVVVVPEVNPLLVTPLSEAFQSVIWHCMVSDPRLQLNSTKW
ncbi:MAG: SIS domain-containing protein [Paracoccaceae bacterium]